MSITRTRSRRLSLFGLGASRPPNSGEQTPRPNTTAPITLSISNPAPQTDDKNVPHEAQKATVRRKLSRKRKPAQQLAASSPPTSYTLSNSHLSVSELSHDSGISYGSQHQPSLKRTSSMNVRAALSSFFTPKPSKKTISGFLHGVEGIPSRKVSKKRVQNGKDPYCYESRSPSPPSPEIRPPSGLGQIASSVDLSTYAREEYEASIQQSRSVSRNPSLAQLTSTPASDFTAASNSPGTVRTKSLEYERSEELFYRPPSRLPSAPSQALKDVLELAMPYFRPYSLSSLASASREFLYSARVALYKNIDSDDVGEDERRRRRVMQTIASNSEIAGMVKSLRWVCVHDPASSSSSTPGAQRNIPRRVPKVSLVSSSEEFILPYVLTLVPHVETLVLLHPYKSILQAFIPDPQSLQRSPNASPVSSSSHQSLPLLSSLRSLTLSGRTTLSTTFGSVLVRFLELHPGIRELNLPDVFCLPNVRSLSRQPSSSSSSLVGTPGHEHIPPVPPLPPFYVATKDKEPPPPPMLPNLTRLTAPLTLATQLVPGRPLRFVDIELTTSLYEGLHPTEVTRALSEAKETQNRVEPKDGMNVNWRAARISRRFGTDSTPSSPVLTPSDEATAVDWKAARQARRAGIVHATQMPSLRELRMRCSAKVDGRTIGRVLIALGKELGPVLENLAIVWCGSEKDLHSQLTLTLSRFCTLQRLEILTDMDNADDSDSPVDQKSDDDFHASISLEQNLVEQWSSMCAQLSHIEFASGRVWKAS